MPSLDPYPFVRCSSALHRPSSYPSEPGRRRPALRYCSTSVLSWPPVSERRCDAHAGQATHALYSLPQRTTRLLGGARAGCNGLVISVPCDAAGGSGVTLPPRPGEDAARLTLHSGGADDLTPSAPLPSEGWGEPVVAGGREPGRGPFLKNTKRSSPGGSFGRFGNV